MKATLRQSLLIGLAVNLSIPAIADDASLETWAVDPLVKVFRDAMPAADQPAIAEVARGEHASLQIVVRCAKAIQGLRADATPLALESSADTKLEPASVRFVGYVPVDRPIQTPPKDQLRKPPADFPDPLLEDQSIDVAANQAQPVWITIPVPTAAKPGTYRGHLRLTATVDGQQTSATLPIAVRVFDAVIERSRLWVTNWFSMQWRHMKIDPKPDSPEYWALLSRYARNMADHRQNMALISPLSLASFRPADDGTLAIDFATFDRWVDIFITEGVIGRIEGEHIGGRAGGWHSQFVVRIRKIENGKVVSASVDPASPEADRFYAQFFPALVKHLKQKGWLDKYTQHLADEPIAANIKSYRALADLARKHAPQLKIIEACHTKDLAGAIDVWVPQLNYLHRDYDYYQQRQKDGEEVFFYTCVFPQGEYANRFIEQPLIKTRLLHWINYRYALTGYLHWGYNHWTKDSPFTHTTRPHGGPKYLPAGDPWIVYPGKDGPLDSLRHEAMRDGIADYELLCLLAQSDPDAAKRLAAKHILDFDRYNGSVTDFRATRRELLERLSQQSTTSAAAAHCGNTAPTSR